MLKVSNMVKSSFVIPLWISAIGVVIVVCRFSKDFGCAVNFEISIEL
jgi:hypothetical protein